MPKKSVYDTRFLAELLFSEDKEIQATLTRERLITPNKIISSITIHEIYRLLQRLQGKDIANIQCNLIKRDFHIVNIDYQLAKDSAELRSSYNMPMADSIIAATAIKENCSLVTDDAHFYQIKNLRVRWF